MARSISSWLSGPASADPSQAAGYPGEALGLPESGPRSLARSGRRFLALLVDWFIAYGLAALAMEVGLISAAMVSTAVLGIWFVIGAATVRLFGFTPGQYALGLLVVPVDRPGGVGLGRAVARGLLLALVIPALFTDADGRGFQDRLTLTAVVRR